MKLIKSLALALSLLSSAAVSAQLSDYSVFDHKLNDQKTIAELMGNMAENGASPEFLVATGDVHHFNGVASTNDPLWMTNYELIYSHPELMISWYPMLGNHEYRGNTQAVIDYSQVSRRWEMPSRYYTHSFNDKGCTLRIVCLDTTPLISRYRNESSEFGHHPIYAQTSKDDIERTDLQKCLEPILERHKVPLYVNGHIHNFQHICFKGKCTQFVTNSAGALARKVKPTKGTVFADPSAGFSIISVTKTSLELRMIDRDGNIIHTVSLTK